MFEGERTIVGICAPTCAGKTTLVETLRQRIHPEPTVLSFDEYDLYPTGSEAMARELQERQIKNWENPNLFNIQAFVRDLGRIRRGQSFLVLTKSRESLKADIQEKIVRPGSLVIVEGVFIYHSPEARDLFDYKFFLDIPIEEMLRRRLARTPAGSIDPWDDPEYIRGEMIRGTEEFVTPQREYADKILNGLLPTAVLAEIIASIIPGR